MMRVILIAIAVVGIAVGIGYLQLTHLSEADLKSRVHGSRVVVTGASLGIGKEIVKEYARLGARDIVIVARSEDKLEQLREDVLFDLKISDSNRSTRIHVHPADLSSEKVCETVINEAVDIMGGIDYLVLNHITNSQYGLWTEKSNYDFITNLITVNTLSYIWMATQALPALTESRGQILVVSSFAGWVGVPHTALYSASKHALRGFFNALRAELTLFKNTNVGITICTIGPTDTAGTKAIQERIGGVSWEDPRVVGNAIVASGAARQRELFYPFIMTYPTIVLHFIAPQLVEKMLHLTMT